MFFRYQSSRSVITCTCSEAMSLATASISSWPSHRITSPYSSHDTRAVSAVGRISRMRPTSAIVASASLREVVSITQGELYPCSACPSRSVAQSSASTVSSAITIVLGRPGEEVDPHPPVELALGLGHERVARPHQHVHRLDRLRPERHRSHRLDATQHVDLVRARPGASPRSPPDWDCPLNGGVAATIRGTPATLAVATDMCALATIGNLPPGT